jgi:hypothetical protein
MDVRAPEGEPRGGQAVDVRGHHLLVPVGPELRSEIIHHEEEHICGLSRRGFVLRLAPKPTSGQQGDE